MAIASAEQKGRWVYVYDEKRNLIRTLPADDGLDDYTKSTVSIRQGDHILIYQVYDENGCQLPATPPPHGA